MSAKLFALFAAVLVLASAASTQAQQPYTLTDIASYGFAPNNLTPGLNASGQVSGTTLDATGANRAFLWTPSSPNAPTGTLSLLPLPGGAVSSGAGPVNSLGQVAGTAFKTNGDNAELWQPNGTPTSVFKGGNGNALNDQGQIAGNISSTNHAALYSVAAGLTDLVGSSGFDESVARGLNNVGQVVGDGGIVPPMCLMRSCGTASTA